MNTVHYPRLGETAQRITLDNGLRICVVPKKGFARNAAYFVTRFGSINTRFRFEGQEHQVPDGVAHYLEHKLFDLPGRDVTAEFAALGANTNAFTSYDMTAYYFSCTENLTQCLRLLLEFVSTPYFTQESVEKERGIIAQEILMYADSPESQVVEDLTAALYRDHPIAKPVGGTVESIAEITPEILELCHRAFYAPANMMLCVAGDVDAQQVAALAEEILPKQRLAVGEPLLPAEPASVPKPLTRRNMDAAMPMFQMGFKCDAGLTGDAFARWELASQLALEALCGESSALYLRLYEQGLIDPSFGSYAETVDGASMVVIGGDSDDPLAVQDAVLAEARRLAHGGISQEEFRRMKKSHLGGKIQALDSFEAICARLCAYDGMGYDYFRFPELVDAITVQELETFLRENIVPQRCAMAIVDPLEQKEDI